MGSYSKELALDILAKVNLCAERAGISEYHFINFGTLLGCVRNKEPIPYDDDVDVGILADKITPEQEMEYYNEVDKAGLFASRRSTQKRTDTNRFLWFSCREAKESCKCCNWFWQPYKGFYYHSKGTDWIEKIGGRLKPPIINGEAILKGIPLQLFDKLEVVDFCGLKVRIPRLYGSVLDVWYPLWRTPGRESSLEDFLLIVGNWKDERTWTVRRR